MLLAHLESREALRQSSLYFKGQGTHLSSSHTAFALGDPYSPEEPRAQNVPMEYLLSFWSSPPLHNFLHAWEQFTSDSWVLQTVLGFQTCGSTVTVHSPSPTSPARVTAPPNPAGIIRPLPQRGSRTFSSRQSPICQLHFLGQKKMGSAKAANHLRDTLLQGDWMAKLDLKNAYLFIVPITGLSRGLLCFRWNHQLEQFICLPFDLSSGPWCFTKLLRSVVASLQAQGVSPIICSSPPTVGFPPESGKHGASTGYYHGVPGLHGRLCCSHPQPSPPQEQLYQERTLLHPLPYPGQDHQFGDCLQPGNLPSTPPPLVPTTAQDRTPSQRGVLCRLDIPGFRSQEQTLVVALELGGMEWESDLRHRPRYHNRL